GVALADAHRHQGNHQGVPAARNSHYMPRSGKSRQALLQQLNFRTENEMAMTQHSVDPRLDLALQSGPLALQVEELDPGIRCRGKRERGRGAWRHWIVSFERRWPAAMATRISSAMARASRPALPSTRGLRPVRTLSMKSA